MLVDRVLKGLIILVFIVLGTTFFQVIYPLLEFLLHEDYIKIDLNFFDLTVLNGIFITISGIIGGIIGFIFSPLFIKKLRNLSVWVETQLNKTPISDVVAGIIGLISGLIIANLLGIAFSNLPIIGSYIPVIFSVIFGYLGIYITIKKRKEILTLFPNKWLRENKKIKQKEKNISSSYKLLDTSVIIDGRIADICSTGFIEGKMVIPIFVLDELQLIADSSDNLKRVRGRRGLDILKRIQTDFHMLVEIFHEDYDDIQGVDSKLIKLAKKIGGKIITNDFNLNKVADLQGVEVLNINDLANAIKPVVIPGECMIATVVKPGKEHKQGIAYLDDGTMIVVEDGQYHMNETMEVMVTSVLQTSAGRMIFAKPNLHND